MTNTKQLLTLVVGAMIFWYLLGHFGLFGIGVLVGSFITYTLTSRRY